MLGNEKAEIAQPSTSEKKVLDEVDLENSPITDNTNDLNSNMEFDAETKAQIGQEAFQRMLESDNAITFEEAKKQVAAGTSAESGTRRQ